MRLQQLGSEIFSKRQTIARAEPDTEQWSERVLGNYLTGESLKTIPASRKKRWEILKWLASKFSEGRRNREAEVNKIFERHYWDTRRSGAS